MTDGADGGAGLAAVAAWLRTAGCVFADDEARLLAEAAGGSASALDGLVARRVAGEPLEWLLGWVEFGGRRLAVGPGVFVPRRRTELLAREAVGRLPRDGVLVELCCGAAAVAATVRARRPDARVWAADVDPAAVACASRNLGAGSVGLGDLFAALPAELRGRIDVLVANAPYVPSAEIGAMPPEARDHEPRVALDGGPDGLDVQRRIAAGAPEWLAPGGTLLVETSRAQAAGSLTLAEAGGLAAWIVRDEDLDATALVARRPVP